MPEPSDYRKQLDLFVGVDKSSLARARNRLKQLNDDIDIQISPATLKEISDGLKGAIRTADRAVNKALTERSDRVFAELMKEYAEERIKIIEANRGDSEKQKGFFEAQDRALSVQVDTEVKLHKMRLEAAKKLKEAMTPNVKKFEDASEQLGKGFMDVLGKAKSGDLSGLVKSLTGSVVGSAKKGSEMADLKSKSAGDPAKAAMLGRIASGLTLAAGVVAVIGASIAVVVALFVAADGAAKTLNKSLLEGASIADFNFKDGVADVTDTMGAARKAAIALATEYRGTSEEFAKYIGQLNQSGFSYREMEQAASGWMDTQAAIAKVTETTFRWTTAMGISFSEAADAEAYWAADFGATLEGIEDNFAAISGFAMMGGFNTKRFFTAVSQATAGMALYNMRIDEAAALLSKTSKILGGTDASDFIQSLTKGFTDESMTDRMNRLIITGGEDSQKIFEAVAARTARGFVSQFTQPSTRTAMELAFRSVKPDFEVKVLNDATELQKVWGSYSAKDRRLVIAQLRENKDEQSSGAARHLETLGRVQDGATKGFDAQVRGMGALDMQGKLAFKLQTLGDKRLNDMNGTELAAFEQYAGTNGAQLEQLLRVESQLMAEYDLANQRGETDGKTFKDWVASNDEATKMIEDVKDINDQATYYAKSTVENTRSVWAILQNTIASILEDTYGLLGSWWASDMELSVESKDKQQKAIDEIRASREKMTQGVEALDKQMAGVEETLSTTGVGSEAHSEALLKKQSIEDEKARKRAAADLFRAQESSVRGMGESQLSSLKGSSDVIAAAGRELIGSNEYLEIISSNMSPEAAEQMKGRADTSFKADAGGGHYKRAVDKLPATVIRAAAWATIVANVFGAKLKGPVEELNSGLNAGNKAVLAALGDSETLTAEQVEQAKAVGAATQQSDTLAVRAARADTAWRDKGYGDMTVKAMLEVTRREAAAKLMGDLGISQQDRAGVLADILDKGAMGNVLAAAITRTGRQEQLQSIEGMAGDFISRPGGGGTFSPVDTVIGMKEGGPLAGLLGGGGSQHITINVNGGDPAQVYQTVKNAMKNSGARTG